MMNWIYFIALLLHILCCVLTFLGIRSELLDVHKHMFFVVLFLPFWGALIVLLLHYQVALSFDGKREIQVEKMKLESEIYKSVTVEDKSNAASIIPMEEALIINSAGERRRLIMDVLNDNPKEYIEFLQKAGNNDDTEVVHYAVTAMVEIAKENDYTMQQFERKLAADPDDFKTLTQYCDFLWSCLEQKMMQGQVEVMNRNHLNELIKKKLAVEESIPDYVRLAKNCLELKNYTEGSAAIDRIGELMPYSEEYILLKIEYFALLEKGSEITKLLNEVENKNIYLSAKAKEAIAFWGN